jgi:hypothetical protein
MVFMSHLKLIGNYLPQLADDYADDSQTDNITMSFSISFRNAIGPGHSFYLRPDTGF